MTQARKLTFPKLRRVKLHRFSLYTLEPSIDVDIPDGVFCLAGANGLGKSTFLASINFAITGIVPNPNREFRSVEEYYKSGQRFNDDFFTGRIIETDRESASISVHLQLGDHLYQLTRGVFESNALRDFVVTNTNNQTIVFDGNDLSTTQRQQEYETRITKAIGLETFRQFVFLQHFVLTFDESRHLLLWDNRVLNQTLYLSIGTDSSKAQRADSLQRELEKAASRARNLNYQASNVRNRIEVLLDAVGETKSHDQDEHLEDIDQKKLEQQHKDLQERISLQQQRVKAKKEELDDYLLRWSEASSELTSLQNEYAREFSTRVQRRPRVELHPLITASKSEARCALCGTQGVEIVETIQQKIDTHHCPLCESSLPENSPDTDSLIELQRIDKEISKAKQRLELAIKAKERVSAELKVSEDELEVIGHELREFEYSNEAILAQLRVSDNGIDATLEKLREEMSELLRQKNKEYALRDEKGKELSKLHRELEQHYYAAEEEFVPLFQELASLFLGVDLVIRMKRSLSIASPDLSLTIEIRGITRREEYQLSESQRFFLDIALRMALVQYVSSQGGEASLFIDTPEGSLDIAYESRAGQMFARFVQKHHNILMTANINSSQLLQRLAKDCGSAKMTLRRMTSWTELSDVQMEEEELFHQAYQAIENALNINGTQTS